MYLSYRRSVLLLLGLLFTLGAWGQTDSVTVALDSTIFSANRNNSALTGLSGARTKVTLELLQRLPSVLGNADPLRFLTTLPGVETGSELDAGLHIQGSESSHSLVAAGGVPIYGAKHMFGLFSTFIPSHYTAMTFSTQATRTNRLGGEIEMEPPANLPSRPSGDFSLGLLSSQATLRLPLGKRTAVFLSGRRSFLDLIHPQQITIDDSPIAYRFGDGNLTVLFRPTEDDTVTADLYTGNDRMTLQSPADLFDLRLGWRNLALSIRWQHGNLSQQVYHSSYRMEMDFSFDEMHASVPSAIATTGYKATFRHGDWTFGADVATHEASPQTPLVEDTYNALVAEEEHQRALESTLSAQWTRDFTDRLSGGLSLKGIHYLSPERESNWALCPQVSLRYNLYQAGRIEGAAGLQKQFLFQTGVTDLGFPCEFWFLAGRHSAPQAALYGMLSYRLDFARDMYALKVEAYYRRLYHQVEYRGDILEFVNSSYDLDDAILLGSGRNYGVNVLLHKQSGKLTGWIGYAFGRSLRRFENPNYPDEYPSGHERLHEANLVFSWSGRKWDAGGSFVAATGTPFTAPDSFYLIGNRIVCHYSEHTAHRLRPYLRADLSGNYYFRKDGRRTFGVNLSVYNVTARKNDLYYRLAVRSGTFSYQPFVLNLSILPSVGIFYRF